ncbi:MAG: VOC family protein [Fimbriimonas ginsengisoli]|uniref:VOC family protein n=1 Tax=Fimbriimonas ginsengisoli TaxID=1005039 RepID=A0A931PTM7_FIMGI|nr:VOC family protein [Fimbriimonas ginsengisoli]
MNAPAGQSQLVKGGVATVFVMDMDRAVGFYTEALGFKLTFRAGDHWASIDAGDGFIIGLHPWGEHSPPVGVAGGIQLGFNVTAPIGEVVASLEAKGVAFPGGVENDEQGGVKIAFFKDPDGNEHYLCEVSHG